MSWSVGSPFGVQVVPGYATPRRVVVVTRQAPVVYVQPAPVYAQPAPYVVRTYYESTGPSYYSGGRKVKPVVKVEVLSNGQEKRTPGLNYF